MRLLLSAHQMIVNTCKEWRVNKKVIVAVWPTVVPSATGFSMCMLVCDSAEIRQGKDSAVKEQHKRFFPSLSNTQ